VRQAPQPWSKPVMSQKAQLQQARPAWLQPEALPKAAWEASSRSQRIRARTRAQ
jgi:hypothetical protein